METNISMAHIPMEEYLELIEFKKEILHNKKLAIATNCTNLSYAIKSNEYRFLYFTDLEISEKIQEETESLLKKIEFLNKENGTMKESSCNHKNDIAEIRIMCDNDKKNYIIKLLRMSIWQFLKFRKNQQINFE